MAKIDICALKDMKDECVDSCITDPARSATDQVSWVSSGEPTPLCWQDLFRILKKGAHLIAFSTQGGYHSVASAIEGAGFEIRDEIVWAHRSDLFEEGTGAPVKATHTPLVLARKPFGGTIKSNVLAAGVGALNIDASRVPVDSDKHRKAWEALPLEMHQYAPSGGRWPANFIHDGSPSVLNLMPLVGEQGLSSGVGRKPMAKGSKWPTLKLEERRADVTAEFFKKIKGLSEFNEQPVELLRYLIRLITPRGGLVFDPFAGFGSTAVAATAEGMRWQGAQTDAESISIIEDRVKAAEGEVK